MNDKTTPTPVSATTDAAPKSLLGSDKALAVLQYVSDLIPVTPKLPLVVQIADAVRNYLVFGDVPDAARSQPLQPEKDSL